MKIVHRRIQQDIENNLFKGKATLIKEIQKKHPEKSIYLNCDEPDIRQALTNVTSTEIKDFIGNNKLVFIDEAQRVKAYFLTHIQAVP